MEMLPSSGQEGWEGKAAKEADSGDSAEGGAPVWSGEN